MGYLDETVRLVHKDPKAVFETNWDGEAPLQMLQNTMPVNVSVEWAARFRNIAESICTFLERKELDLEEDLEQSWIANHEAES
jgi:hypothetical protein